MRTRFSGALMLGALTLLTLACNRSPHQGSIIAVSHTEGQAENGQLLLLNPDRPGKDALVLSDGFYAAMAPSLSHDGRSLYFQGKMEADDRWQIWGMDLAKKKAWQVTDEESNCRFPVAMPNGNVVYSRSAGEGAELWVCASDGCCPEQLTYNLGNNARSNILWEGRLICINSGSDPTNKPPVFIIMRRDGTKSELYHRCANGRYPVSAGRESASGHLYFINDLGQVARVNHKRPLHTGEVVTTSIEERFSSVFPRPDGQLLVALEAEGKSQTSIHLLDPESGSLDVAALYESSTRLSDLILVQTVDPRPRILPSAVNPEKESGLLMSQDINHSLLPPHPGIADTVATQVRISGTDQSFGETEVMADGSFYLKLDANTSFRIEALNAAGEVVRGPSAWMYLRQNERRACTGCHADQEMAPVNVQPFAVKEDPVVMHATGM